MKIKRFNESSEIHKFWLIRTDEPYYEISLRKLKWPEYDINRMIIKNEHIIKFNTIYVSDEYQWMPGNNYGKNYYEKENYIYQGEVNVTDEDILNYNIQKNSKKFNL